MRVFCFVAASRKGQQDHDDVSLRALLLLLLLLCMAMRGEYALASSEDDLEEDDVEPGEEEEQEGDMFDSILKQVEVTSMAGPKGCQHAAELGDRVYLEYAGIEHATGECFLRTQGWVRWL